jgi:DNA-binding response OmpR family regulator
VPYRSRTVLVVDDDEPIRAVLAALIELELEGARIVSVGDGIAAIAAAARERPDLVVLDYMLPGENGDAVLAALRALRPRGLAVLGVSAAPDLAGGFRASCDAFVRKPFDVDELVDAMRWLLAPGDGRRRRSAAAETE